MYPVVLLCGNEGRREVDFCVVFVCYRVVCISSFIFLCACVGWLYFCVWSVYSVYALVVGRFVKSNIGCTLLETLPSSRSLGIKSK